MAENLYMCLGCKELISKDLLVCPKCGQKTAAGRVKDLRANNLRANNLRANTKKVVESNKKKTEEVSAGLGLQIFVYVFIFSIIGGCVALFNNGSESVREPDEFDSIYARIWCKDQIKEQLKDPNSYKFYSATILRTTGEYKEYGAARIDFGATNSFGGMVRQTAICDKFERGGKEYIRVNILP